MPKGYGYDKAPRKSPAFKMTGFSYAGNSPVKGKRKQMEQAAASERGDLAMDKIEDFAELKTKGTDILSAGSTQYGQTSNPITKRAPLKQETLLSIPTIQPQELPVNMPEFKPQPAIAPAYNPPAPKISFSDKFKSAMGSEIGQAAGKALVEGGVKLGVTALASGKKKDPKKTVNVASGFSQMNITGRS